MFEGGTCNKSSKCSKGCGWGGKTLLFWSCFHFITELLNFIVVKYIRIWKQTPSFITFPYVFCLETRELPHQNPFTLWIWFGICNPPWGDNAVRGTWEDAPFPSGADVRDHGSSPPIDPHRDCLWPHTVMNSLKSLLDFFWGFISCCCYPAAAGGAGSSARSSSDPSTGMAREQNGLIPGTLFSSVTDIWY